MYCEEQCIDKSGKYKNEFDDRLEETASLPIDVDREVHVSVGGDIWDLNPL